MEKFIRMDGEVWKGEEDVLQNLRYVEGGSHRWKEASEKVKMFRSSSIGTGSCMEGEEEDVYKEGKRLLERGGRWMEMF